MIRKIDRPKTNRPPKGARLKTEPLRSLEDINKIKNLLRDSPRNMATFLLGINTNLRISDLCNLKISQVKFLKEHPP